MLRSLLFQIQLFLALVKKVMVISAIVGQAGFFIWVGLWLSETPVYKSWIAANNVKDNFVSEVQKFNPFKDSEQEKD